MQSSELYETLKTNDEQVQKWRNYYGIGKTVTITLNLNGSDTGHGTAHVERHGEFLTEIFLYEDSNWEVVEFGIQINRHKIPMKTDVSRSFDNHINLLPEVLPMFLIWCNPVELYITTRHKHSNCMLGNSQIGVHCVYDYVKSEDRTRDYSQVKWLNYTIEGGIVKSDSTENNTLEYMDE